MNLQALLANQYVAGALTGLLAAAVVDVAAFRSWKSVNEALAYEWPIAFWRWGQGAVSGLIAAAGIGAVS